MSIDTRARRAAEGVRASVTGVSTMTMLEELKHGDETRNRNRTAASVVALLVVLALGAWYAVGLGKPSAQHEIPPVGTASAAPTASDGDTRPVIGTLLEPPVTARLPEGWMADTDSNWLGVRRSSGISFEVSKPIVAAIDPVTDERGTPPRYYHDWLLQHPWVQVLSDQPVVVDGVPTYITTYRIVEPTRGPKPRVLDTVTDLPDPMTGIKPGSRIIDVAIPLRHVPGADPWAAGYRLLRDNVSAIEQTDPQQAALMDAGIRELLASYQLP